MLKQAFVLDVDRSSVGWFQYVIAVPHFSSTSKYQFFVGFFFGFLVVTVVQPLEQKTQSICDF